MVPSVLLFCAFCFSCVLPCCVACVVVVCAFGGYVCLFRGVFGVSGVAGGIGCVWGIVTSIVMHVIIVSTSRFVLVCGFFGLVGHVGCG